ncbi:hypothetical protein [Morganella morganii]|uniref:hypothetical protein n=1 Tax=Morganella morganii TaxID=582 RepID=UPI001454D496|nr:hypothetical protein [Morganella morganii]
MKKNTEDSIKNILNKTPRNNREKLVYMISKITIKNIEKGELEWEPSGWGVRKKS